MMQRFDGLFRRDFWMKGLALALAILLWTMVVSDYNKEANVEFDVQLGVKQHPVFEMFEGKSDKEAKVEVRVTGPNLLVSDLTEGEIRAWVDYSRITEPGKPQEVEVQVELPPRVRDQVKYRVTPATISVTLVKNGVVNVPLLVQPDSGVVNVGAREFRYTAASAEKSISMSGRMDALTLVRWGLVNLEPVDRVPPLVNGVLKEKSARIQKPVTPVDATSKPVEKLAQPYADVVLTWEELPPGKRVPVRPRTEGSLPPGFELAGIVVEPESITIRSAAVDGRLPDVTAVETEPISLTGQAKRFTTVARVVAPEGTSVAQTSVNVTVNIVEAKVEKIFGAVPVALTGQPANVEVTLPVPTVQVRLAGPFTLMQGLDAGSLKVTVELDGLTEGRHRVPVKVVAPAGVTEVAVDPAILEVVITNR